MAITSVTPASSSTIQTGDSFSFTVDDTYTSMVIQSQSDTALESVYNSATTGAQAGYTVVVVDNGDGTHTFTVGRDAGWDVSPQLVYITEDETGSSATTNLSYALQVEQTFPQGQSPYNGADDSATTDHGTLGGLSDDDHSQYHNDTRGDVRYGPKANVTANTAHTGGDGSDHADVATNSAHVAGDGSDHADVATNTSDIAERVEGPASSVDKRLCIFNGVTGKLIADSGDAYNGFGQLTLGQNAFIPALTLTEQAALSTPATGKFALYAKTDGKIYGKNDGGTEYDLTVSGGGGAGDVTGGSASFANEAPTYTDTSGKVIGRSNFKFGSNSPTVGTRTLGATSGFVGGSMNSGGTMSSTGNGSIAAGFVNQPSGTGTIAASASGGLALGYVNATTGTANLTNSGAGSFVSGVVSQTVAGTGNLTCTSSDGSFVQGSVGSGGGKIDAFLGGGCFAQGNTTGTGIIDTFLVSGALARGNAGTSSQIRASGNGSFANGNAASGGVITAGAGAGSLAGGNAITNAITASGAGSFAWGDSTSGAIVASAANSLQIGVGTNAVATSMSVGDPTGTGVRLCGAGAPGTPQDGDIWVDGSGDVNISSSGGGATAVVLNLPAITGSRGGNAALADLLTKLAAMNLITDSTT